MMRDASDIEDDAGADADADADAATELLLMNRRQNHHHHHHHHHRQQIRCGYGRMRQRLRAALAVASPRTRLVYAAVVSSLGYVFTYCWKQPIFMLPTAYEERGGAFGRLDLQTSMAMAQTVGFALAKPLGIFAMSRPCFYRHRMVTLIGLMALAAVFSGCGVWLFDPILGPLPASLRSGAAQAIVAAGLSAVPASLLYGGWVSFLEGRDGSEVLFACLNFAVVVAGGFSRGLSNILLTTGVQPRFVPLLAAGIGLPIASLFIVLLDCLPPPTVEEQALKGKRGAMSHAERMQFVCGYLPGMVGLLVAYMACQSLRSYRDFYARELFDGAEAGGGNSLTYFLADLPGAVSACTLLSLLSKIQSPVQTFYAMLSIMLMGAVVVGAATYAFHHQLISGSMWMYLLGLGIYTSYGIMGSSNFDTLMAATKTNGNAMFLVFLADGMGYIGVIAILLYKSFSDNDSGSDDQGYVDIFVTACISVSMGLAAVLVLSLLYFRYKFFNKSTFS